ncbi:protein TWIN LOV 1-like isoform X2 [Olea europaea var. sylvestris]|uniref:protein TWIN LOV 1-like isoform X2 n=1 Tax=Olea europaea var. sylvestris TaxID=158386 RepID=UPI000C1D87F1|nr:protein TWIN LOV 1-like isoform X2 [Olea europaea var. sylvestris]
MESQLGMIEQSFNLRYSGWVREALNELSDNFTITDPSISGHPIVFASNGFFKTVGYTEDEVIGRNGRMFQGPETDRRSVMEIREAIREERAIQISLLNYKKDGTPFWILFNMCPVFNKEDGRVIHFVGVQVPISRRPRRSGCTVVRDAVNSSENGALFCQGMFRCCRRELCSDTVMELGPASALNSVSIPDDEVEMNVPCEASELEKRKANVAVSNVLSVLTHYSELTGKLVCGKRSCLAGMGLLGSSLNIPLGSIKQSFVLSDPHLPDMPIVYASDSFVELTGYARHEALGRNCRFLSGKDTDPATQFQIKECIQTEQPCTVRILNYRKDKTPFWNLLHISPARNALGKGWLRVTGHVWDWLATPTLSR